MSVYRYVVRTGPCLASFLVCASAAMALPAQYELTGLGFFPGGTFSEAYSLNENDQVVGMAENPNGYPRAFVWDKVNGMQNLGTMGASQAWAYGINDQGQIVGSVRSGAKTTAFVYQEIGGVGFMSPLNLGIPSSDGSQARDINNNGMIVGDVYNPTEGTGYAYMYELSSGTVTNLGTLSDGDYAMAWAINDHDQVAGSSDTVIQGHIHAFRWEGGTMNDLGTLYGDYLTFGFGINDYGVVVGEARDSEFRQRAFRIEPGGSMENLGVIGEESDVSGAEAINNSGVIVGYSMDAAFAYEPGVGMIDLNTRLDPDLLADGWHLLWAYDINNKGHIVGKAMNPDGNIEAVLLTPEPASLLMVMLAGGLMLRRSRS